MCSDLPWDSLLYLLLADFQNLELQFACRCFDEEVVADFLFHCTLADRRFVRNFAFLEVGFVAADDLEGFDLAGAEVELVDMEHREFALRNALGRDVVNYDYILIDCPPSLSLVTINALVAADAVIVPLQCEFLALEGITDLIRNINQIKRKFNPKLELQGVVLTMYDKRNNLSQMVEDDVRNFFGKKVYQTVIPRNVRVSEAPSHGKPVLIYDFRCPGSQAYISLTGEVLKREKELLAC